MTGVDFLDNKLVGGPPVVKATALIPKPVQGLQPDEMRHHDEKDVDMVEQLCNLC